MISKAPSRPSSQNAKRLTTPGDKNLLPELPPQTFEALKESIARFGVQYSIVVDETKNTIDGFHRKRACDELGIHCPTIVIGGLTPDEKRQLAYTLNHARRHVTPTQKRDAAATLIKSKPQLSDRTLALMVGVDHKTIGRIRRGLVETGECPSCQQREGQDGKTRRMPRIHAETPSEVERAVEALRRLGDAAPARTILLRRAELMARQLDDHRRELLPPVPQDDSDPVQIVHSDFRELELPEEAAAMVLTDPLYHRKHLPLWDDLARLAARWLRPDGGLVAYSGNAYLDEVMALLRQHLTFHSLAALVHGGIIDGSLQPIHSRQLRSGWKPILLYGRPQFKPRKYVKDVFLGAGKVKDLHEYQQCIDEALYYVETLTAPGDLIVDPFGGSFTVAEAVVRVGGGRRFIGCDIDEHWVRVGRARIQRVRAELEKAGKKLA